MIKKILLLCLLLVFGAGITAAVIINPFGPSPLNSYRKNGLLSLPGLTAPVVVHRDDNGLPYIYAENLDDVFLAQGFVVAQDRLFQMDLSRRFSSGRLAELVGETAVVTDKRMRTLGFRRQAEKHFKLLGPETLRILGKYAEGVNAFIQARPSDLPLEFKLAGLAPQAWSPVDSLAILYVMGWGSAANLQDEIVAANLVDKLGLDKAREIFPLNINPESPPQPPLGNLDPIAARWPDPAPEAAFRGDPLETPLALGSNAWVVGPQKSASRFPLAANDPHLDARILPSPWHPCGLVAPGLRAVGGNIPGIPGMIPGRTEHLSIGVTNSYGDAQDLYRETIDPADPSRYLEGARSLPFTVVEEAITVRDKKAAGGFREEKIKILLTRRGPVVSGLLPGLREDQVYTARWSSFEAMGSELGFEKLLFAHTVKEAQAALKDVRQVALNFLLADRDGNIGWQTTGRLPIRSQGEGLLPYQVDGERDNWTGWIPWEEMPREFNPDRGWIGSCNHLPVPPDYPYYYSTHLSPSFRQGRLMELLNASGRTSAEEQWAFQRDVVNPMAGKIVPIMVNALKQHDDSRPMADVLSGWDCRDQPDAAGPAVFQAVYREFVKLTYQDELGRALADRMLMNWYFWQERTLALVLEGTSNWFDDIGTPDRVETRDDLFHQAAQKAFQEFSPTLGPDPAAWAWGKIHRHEFVSPLFRSGPLKGLLGGGSHPAPGSGETLYRGLYAFEDPFKVRISASLRLVVDLGDPDKMLAVLPGGTSGRLFDPHLTDQLQPFMEGEKKYWWFSDQAIKEHARSTLRLVPVADRP
ncbi:MAG: penicillin acylase family protein [Pseudomonadota bacterium]